MGTGYTRNDSANNIADGNVINASDLDGEFDAVQAAFNASTGHSHDGTTGEGPKIDTAGLADDAVTGAKIDSTTTITAAGFTGPLTGTASNAALLDNIDSTSFLRSDAADTKTSGDLSFSDNVKATFGAGSDLQIFSDGTHGIIKESGSGDLLIYGNNLRLGNADGSELYILGNNNAEVQLRYDNATKLATTATGTNTTGISVATDTVGSSFNQFYALGNGNVGGIRFGNTTKTNGYIYYDNGGNMNFHADGPERMRIDSSGNLLVGTTTGGGTIGTYNGFGAFAGGSIFSAATSNRSIFSRRSTDGSIIEFRKDSTGVGVIGTQNWGIGTSNPAGPLEVHKSGGDANVFITTGVTTSSTTILFGDSASDDRGRVHYDHNNDSMRLHTAGSERMRIDSSGRVGIGTSSPDFKAEIVGGTNDGLHIKDAESATVFGGLFTQSANLALVARSNHALTFGTNDAERMRIDSSGNLLVGTTTGGGTIGTYNGFGAFAGGSIFSAATSNRSIFSRRSTDGSIIEFRKDSTGVGVIGTQNWGIGTSNPAGPLEVHKSGGDANVFITTGVTTSSTTILFGDSASDDRGRVHYDHNNDSMRLHTAGSERMRITSAGNVGVGTASPERALHVEGAGLIKNTSGEALFKLQAANNSNSILELADTNDGNVGRVQYEHDNNAMLLYTNDSERMRIDSSGNVGIGGLPSQRLHVYGGAVQFTNTQNTYLQINTTDTHLYTAAAHPLRFGTNSTERMRIDSSGRVGIGTASPSSILHTSVSSGANKLIVQNTAASGQSVLQLNTDSTTPGQCQIYMGKTSAPTNGQVGYDPNNDFLYLYTNNSERMRITSAGNVGIGSSSAIEKLRVSGNVELYNDNTDGYIWFHDTGTRSWSIGSDQSTGNFAITNVQGLASGHKVQINGSGDFLVGTNGISIGSPGNSETGLDVTQGGVAQLSATGIALFLRRTGGNGDLVRFHAGTGAGGAGSISVTTTSTSYNTSSDHRLKENITDISNAIDRVKILAPKRFNFIADADTTVDGFLAHEAQAVVPEAVTGTHNEVDEDGNAIMQGIDQSKFVPLLTAALKEAITKIEDLETRLAALEAN